MKRTLIHIQQHKCWYPAAEIHGYMSGENKCICCSEAVYQNVGAIKAVSWYSGQYIWLHENFWVCHQVLRYWKTDRDFCWVFNCDELHCCAQIMQKPSIDTCLWKSLVSYSFHRSSLGTLEEISVNWCWSQMAYGIIGDTIFIQESRTPKSRKIFIKNRSHYLA